MIIGGPDYEQEKNNCRTAFGVDANRNYKFNTMTLS